MWWVLIISAGVLAFIVLYNLTNINVTEREKELATIKVLGFYDGEVSAYIYRETILLTVIGTALGLVLGMGLHQFVIRTAEVDMVMFGREVYWPSYVWSTLLTFLFSALVNLVMHHKLKNISMVGEHESPGITGPLPLPRPRNRRGRDFSAQKGDKKSENPRFFT